MSATPAPFGFTFPAAVSRPLTAAECAKLEAIQHTAHGAWHEASMLMEMLERSPLVAPFDFNFSLFAHDLLALMTDIELAAQTLRVADAELKSKLAAKLAP